ncbi:MAG: hypothetical protein K0S01_3736 [Herbinix sp.]|jgi:uncharacterized protein YbbK (DUF523 family)|nr:hypothetical protein [Herbinix sp.]
MYIVSACLAGVNCKYSGRNNENKNVIELVRQGKAIPICPEQLGGLPTPRACCEIVMSEEGNKKVISKDGHDYTKEFMEGAEKTLEIAKIIGADKAILQPRSPSCGCGLIYDGTFSGNLVKGNGLTAERLLQNGIKVYMDTDFDDFLI